MNEIAGQGAVILTPDVYLTIVYCIVFALLLCVIFLAWPSTDDGDKDGY